MQFLISLALSYFDKWSSPIFDLSCICFIWICAFMIFDEHHVRSGWTSWIGFKNFSPTRSSENLFKNSIKTNPGCMSSISVIMISKRIYQEDRNNTKHATTKFHNIQGVENTYGAWLCSNGELDSTLWWKALLRLESPMPNRLPRYDPLQISFLKKDGGISKRKTI